jgi:translation initiation factor 1
MKDRKRIPTDGETVAWKSPFAALQHVERPPAVQSGLAASDTGPAAAATSAHKQKHRGRVDILRQTAHRGGKTVTVITGFVGISQAEKEQLAKAMQKACGTGGTVKEGRIEIQGDRREDIARILTEAGFRPVFAGG